jgi:hypothetical protein
MGLVSSATAPEDRPIVSCPPLFLATIVLMVHLIVAMSTKMKTWFFEGNTPEYGW